jgi:2-oxoglutarate dehydrogenase E1 component
MTSPCLASALNASLIDQNYSTWQTCPAQLSPDWQAFFQGFELGRSAQEPVTCTPQLPTLAVATSSPSPGTASDSLALGQAQHHAVDVQTLLGCVRLIEAYRTWGHLQAQLNPLSTPNEPQPIHCLHPRSYGLHSPQAQVPTQALDFAAYAPQHPPATVQALLGQLQATYSGTLALQYMHIQDPQRRQWLQHSFETLPAQHSLSPDERLRCLWGLIRADQFEVFLHQQFVGQKRFSLEGAKSLIPALQYLAEQGAQLGITHLVMGMAHRGRLNVLVNFLGKPLGFIFREFSENYIPDTIHGDGDVKYHLGYDVALPLAPGGSLAVHLAANPSHLESVNPVVMGRARAQQEALGAGGKQGVLPLLIHGDAAFAGQGIVTESLNLMALEGYGVGGVLHVVINNQIGFTTDPVDARSSRYTSDWLKGIDAPIILVNADDPDAVLRAFYLALLYRQRFGQDVVIDLYGYRRFGHNEADEPAFTQPLMYAAIQQHPRVNVLYQKRLIADGVTTQEAIDAFIQGYRFELSTVLQEAKAKEAAVALPLLQTPTKFQGSSGQFQPPFDFRPADTTYPLAALQDLGQELLHVPQGFQLNPKVSRQLEAKALALQTGQGIDWGFAESLALASLLSQGHRVRLSGQDSQRGTFSHRHAVYHDARTGARYTPLAGLSCVKNSVSGLSFQVYNSPLSEAAVLGFEYGFSLHSPRALVLWEAQFGDFANGAQVVIDQYLAAGESKWRNVSGLVLLLPHGYQGQGPEHSSARLERFLQLCGDDNLQVCHLSTPAQYFHALRRQLSRPFLKPLVLMAPKNLLRHKDCISTLDELASGRFHEVLPDPVFHPQAQHPAHKVKRVVLCSGKLYYELEDYRREHQRWDVALVRLEQLYPLHHEALSQALRTYPSFKTLVWCQEEPQNMGAWHTLLPVLQELVGKSKLLYAGRPPAASTATGVLAFHKVEQAKLIQEAFQT